MSILKPHFYVAGPRTKKDLTRDPPIVIKSPMVNGWSL